MNVAGFWGVSEVHVLSPTACLGLNTSRKLKIKENSILGSEALYNDMCIPSFRMDLLPPSLG
jgi:hypothetical protein